MDDEATRRSTGIPLSWLYFAPLGAAALAYVGDIVFGSAPVVSVVNPESGFEWYAVITGIFCALEALIVVPLYLRNRRYTHAAALFAYLLAFSAAVFWFASFQAG